MCTMLNPRGASRSMAAKGQQPESTARALAVNMQKQAAMCITNTYLCLLNRPQSAHGMRM